MPEKPIILCVDDEEFNQPLIEAALGQSFDVRLACNGAVALQQMATECPDLLVMDVEMPVMNGYECCQRIRALEQYADIPILFLSVKDSIEDRLQGFEAGGDDYLTKPFNFQLLSSKVKNLLNLAQERRDLEATLSYASRAAITAMGSMSELACVLEAMKNVSASTDQTLLAESILGCLNNFGLEGVVQLRSSLGSLTLTSKGPASPLDNATIQHMSGMDKIVLFKSRLSITHPHITLLINNMPIADEERCGRLREHLAALAQAADIRVQGMAAIVESAQRGELILMAIREIAEILSHIEHAQHSAKTATTLAVHKINNTIKEAFIGIALSDAQESYLADVIRRALIDIVEIQNLDLNVQNKLSTLIARLQNAAPAAA